MSITGNLSAFAATLGAGVVMIAAGYSISRIAITALEGIARQPEAAPKLQVTMLIAAALIEGIALFCAVICFMVR